MAVLDFFSQSDIPCIDVENLSPLTAVSTILSSFTVDVPVAGGTLATVSVDDGDGNVIAASLVLGDKWTYDTTYTAPGSYWVQITATLTTGETWTECFTVVAS